MSTLSRYTDEGDEVAVCNSLESKKMDFMKYRYLSSSPFFCVVGTK